MAHTVWPVEYDREASLLERAGALDLALTAVVTGSAGLLAWGAWSFANPTIRTAARIAVLYLSNARG
jgi:TRAP-type C4-dicarboxylate transport system permease small subunit